MTNVRDEKNNDFLFCLNKQTNPKVFSLSRCIPWSNGKRTGMRASTGCSCTNLFPGYPVETDIFCLYNSYCGCWKKWCSYTYGLTCAGWTHPFPLKSVIPNPRFTLDFNFLPAYNVATTCKTLLVIPKLLQFSLMIRWTISQVCQCLFHYNLLSETKIVCFEGFQYDLITQFT